MARTLNKDEFSIGTSLFCLIVQGLSVVWLYQSVASTMNEKDRNFVVLKVLECVGLFDIDLVYELSGDPYERHQALHMDILVAVVNDIVSSQKAAVRDDEVDLRIKAQSMNRRRASHRLSLQAKDLDILIACIGVIDHVL